MEQSYKLVLIEWVDSVGGPESWEYAEGLESLKPMAVSSVGYLIEDGKDYKTLVQNIGRGQVRGRISIPTCSIIKVKRLRV